jgi:hypothetical protein
MLAPNPGQNALKTVRFRVAGCRGNHFGLILSIHALNKPPPTQNFEKLFSYIKVPPANTGLVQQPVQMVASRVALAPSNLIR